MKSVLNRIKKSAFLWSKFAPWTVIVFSILGLIVSMRTLGRFWICECQKVYFWVSDTWSANNSQHLFDPYGFTHIEHGIFFFAAVWPLLKRYSWQWRFAVVIAMECFWEALENSPIIIDRYRTTTASLGYTGDTVINALGDVILAAVGFAIFERFGFKWAVVTVVAIELILLFTIRDNLFLNIFLLLIPAPGIVEWQIGNY